MMFVGVDHGTSGIRFAGLKKERRKRGVGEAEVCELSRERAAELSGEEILSEVEGELKIERDGIKLLALTYSMGDGFSTIKSVEKVPNRGVRSGEGAGARVGGGTKVFDALKDAGVPAILIPGIHAGSEKLDRRMKFFSHGASPEKVGVAYHIYKKGFENFVFSDISSNTVTVAVASGVVVGAVDACLGAPGLFQGPLDLQLLREIESGRVSANEAFSNAGVLRKRWVGGERGGERGGVRGGVRKEGEEELVLDALALFAAMEISAMQVLMRDCGVGVEASRVFLTGSVGEKEEVKRRIERLLDSGDSGIESLTRWSAAVGCAEIARDVFYGGREILGIAVESIFEE
ncbi:MAG TPA: methanogenesis marker 12 protein [Methanomicrobia archaeon]|nr:methanogenesis marker 12 protein [Methanomicrobia archaeon]